MTILIGLPANPGFIKTDCVLSLMAAQAEDFSFCQRWRTLCNRDNLGAGRRQYRHIGEFTYQGNYLEHLKAQS